MNVYNIRQWIMVLAMMVGSIGVASAATTATAPSIKEAPAASQAAGTASKGRMPGAIWRPIKLKDNYYRGGQKKIRGVVLHIMQGTLVGSDNWFRNPKATKDKRPSGVSAHLGMDRTGKLYQWFDVKDRPKAQGAGNTGWISVENEGTVPDALSAKQIERNAQILAWAHKTYGVPLKVTNDPNGSGLGHHSMGGAAWGGHTCPGPAIIAQKAKIVARAKEIVGTRSIPRPQPKA